MVKSKDNEYNVIVNFLKSIINKHVYNNSIIISNEIKGSMILNTLLDTFTKSILNLYIPDKINNKLDIFNNKNNKNRGRDLRVFDLLSNNYVDNFMYEYRKCTNDEDKTYYKLRLVVDFISGMTDTYALDIYQTIEGIK